MYLLAPKMDKSLPFEKVQPQWQLLYLFFWECTEKNGEHRMQLQEKSFVTKLNKFCN